MIAQGEPHLKRTESSRQFDRFFEVGVAFDGIFIEWANIIAAVGKCRSGSLRITMQQASTVEGLVEPFVRIEGERVCSGKSPKFSWYCNCGQRTIRAVYVKPRSVLGRDLRNLSQWVECACVHGPRRRNYCQGRNAKLLVSSHTFFKSFRNHSEALIHSNEP